MSAITPETRARIKAHLEVFINSKVEEYRNRRYTAMDNPAEYLAREADIEGKLKPFHAAILSPEMLRISAFERGFVTSLGTSFEECARLIALKHHHEARRSYDMTEMLNLAALNEIDHQVARFEHAAELRQNPPVWEEMINAVLAARDEAEQVNRTIRADLYIQAHDGTEYYFEIKSPKPNKGQCLEIMQRLLRVHLMRQPVNPNVQAYFAMAYNPYGPKREDYRWSIPRTYLPFGDILPTHKCGGFYHQTRLPGGPGLTTATVAQ